MRGTAHTLADTHWRTGSCAEGGGGEGGDRDCVRVPGLVGSFLWDRPGLCQCRFRMAILACIGPKSPNFRRLVPA